MMDLELFNAVRSYLLKKLKKEPANTRRVSTAPKRIAKG